LAVFWGILLDLVNDPGIVRVGVLLLFAVGGESCGNDVDGVIRPREETGQDAPVGCPSDEHFPFFVLGVFFVVKVDRVPVLKHG